MKICCYAIAKNEEKFVERFCDVAREADLILIADTGSTDGTIGAIKKWQAISSTPIALHQIHVAPWRFDTAHNAALALVPPDMDVCLSVDLDEVLQPGWRQEIERVWKLGETTRLRYMYDWSSGIIFKYEKIHARSGYRWVYPVHEIPVPYGIEEKFSETDFMMYVHKPDPQKSRGDYLGLLKMATEEDPDEPKAAFYYARELNFYGKHQEALMAADRYLALPRAGWNQERSFAHRIRGRCYTALGSLENAERAFNDAIRETPNIREPHCAMGQLMYAQSRWKECLDYAQKALSITEREMFYTAEPEAWSWKPHDLAAIAAHWLGMKELSLEQGKLSVAAATPSEEARLRQNLKWYEGIAESMKEGVGIKDTTFAVVQSATPPIVVCHVHDHSIPVLLASIAAYCPQTKVLAFKSGKSTYGQVMNTALEEAFQTYDEVILTADDVVLTPTSMLDLMEEVNRLKSLHGDKLGVVASYADSSRYGQQSAQTALVTKEASIVALECAWLSKKAFEVAHFPSINWYAEDVFCEDLMACGFKHFLSKAYVHHAGSQTIGRNYKAHIEASMPWLKAHRAKYIDKWGLREYLKKWEIDIGVA